MPMLALAFPPIDPVLVQIGPFAVRWYALAYIAGFLIGWRMCLWLARQNPDGPQPKLFDDFLVWAVIGTIIGGRLGYIFFYQLDSYLKNPLEIFYIWHGGMSFHGGMLGVIVAAILFTRRHKIPFFAFSDIVACVVPVGLGLGRIANFINGELFGRVSEVPWAVIFPRGGELPRHPSQLYEAGLEGLLLLVTLVALAQIPTVRKRYGILSGIFLTNYGLFRIIGELFREPDAQLGFIYGYTTMGQILSIPMIIAGTIIIAFALRRKSMT